MNFIRTFFGKKSKFHCATCDKVLEEIGVPPAIRALGTVQMSVPVINIGESVDPEIKADPYLYRGLYCPSCNQVFCPACAGMQTERCPRCQKFGLMPGYRPLLRRIT